MFNVHYHTRLKCEHLLCTLLIPKNKIMSPTETKVVIEVKNRPFERDEKLTVFIKNLTDQKQF